MAVSKAGAGVCSARPADLARVPWALARRRRHGGRADRLARWQLRQSCRAKDGAFAVIGADLAEFRTTTLMAIGIGGIARRSSAILLYPVFQRCVSLVDLRFALWRYRRHVAAAHRPSVSHLPALHRSCLVVHDGSFHRHRRSGLRHLRAVSAVHIAGSQIPGRDVIGAGIGILFYVAFALGISIMHQVLITFGLWRAAAQSAEISDAPILDTVEAKAGLAPRSAKAWSMRSVSGVSRA